MRKLKSVRCSVPLRSYAEGQGNPSGKRTKLKLASYVNKDKSLSQVGPAYSRPHGPVLIRIAAALQRALAE